MAKYKTRNKIKNQGDMIEKQLERCIEHLFYMDTLAGGGSDYINEWLPMLTEAINELVKVVKQFNEGL